MTQLDIALEYSTVCIRSIAPEPAQAKADHAAFLDLWSKLDAGDISREEYRSRMPPSRTDFIKFTGAMNRIRFFAESFYMMAWRLRQIINSRPPREFPSLGRLSAAAIVRVRNLLIEHPDHAGDAAKFEQHFVLTDSGLVIKSSSVLIRGGKSFAASDSVDQGLFANASILEVELRELLTNAVVAKPGR